MHVLLLSQHFWPEEFLINSIAENLYNSDVKITVLTAQPNYPDGEIFLGYKGTSWTRSHSPIGINILRVPTYPRKNGSAFNLIANYASFIVCSLFFGLWLLRKEKFDLVFVYATSPIFQALTGIAFSILRRIPIIIWVQDLWPEVLVATGFIKNKIILKVISLFVSWIYRRADLLLVQSKAFEQEIMRYAPDTKVIYCPNPAIEIREPVTSKNLALEDSFSIMFAGNLGRAQALETVCDAAKLLKKYSDIKVVLVGTGSQFEYVLERIEIEKLNIILTGPLPREQMPGILAQSSALLVSLASDENISKTVPSKIPTYLSAEKPIIGALNGEGKRILTESKSAIIGPAEDAAILAANILKLRDLDKNQRVIMGRNAKQFYQKHFKSEQVNQRLIKLFNLSIKGCN